MRWVLVLVVLVIVLGAGFGCSYNRFTTQEETVRAAFAEVDNNLQRRSDLIPNLVETVKGFAQQERDVFQAVADARAKMAGAATPADRIEAGRQESSALARLLVVVENYPQLKSDARFAALMDELAGTENRLAQSRRRYNEQVQTFNAQVRRFPGNLTATIFGFNEYPYYDVPETAKTLPRVDFGKGK
jgi:LemA protein